MRARPRWFSSILSTATRNGYFFAIREEGGKGEREREKRREKAQTKRSHRAWFERVARARHPTRMHFIRKLLNLVSFRRPRANSVEPTEFRETSAGRICCSLECRYPAVSHPFSSFLLPRPNRQFSIFSSQNLGNSWIFLFSSDISFFSFFTRLPFASNAIDTSFQPGRME